MNIALTGEILSSKPGIEPGWTELEVYFAGPPSNGPLKIVVKGDGTVPPASTPVTFAAEWG